MMDICDSGYGPAVAAVRAEGGSRLIPVVRTTLLVANTALMEHCEG